MGKIQTTIDHANDVTVNIASGKITVADIVDTVKAYLAENQTNNVLWDFCNADGSEITGDDVRRLYQFLSEQPGAAIYRRIAIVVARDFGYGMARQSQTYAEISRINADYQIFHTRQEALDWFMQPQ